MRRKPRPAKLTDRRACTAHATNRESMLSGGFDLVSVLPEQWFRGKWREVRASDASGRARCATSTASGQRQPDDSQALHRYSAGPEVQSNRCERQWSRPENMDSVPQRSAASASSKKFPRQQPFPCSDDFLRAGSTQAGLPHSLRQQPTAERRAAVQRPPSTEWKEVVATIPLKHRHASGANRLLRSRRDDAVLLFQEILKRTRNERCNLLPGH